MRTEDGYIIQECLNGNETAFGFLVDKYKRSVYALAYSKVRNFHDAQDITQEAFISAYKNLRSLRQWDSFMGWLYRITKNLCKAWLRANSRRPDVEFIEDQDPDILNRLSTNSYQKDTVLKSMQESLESLPGIYREVLTLRYFGGMNIREISRFLGTSPSTVDRRIREAMDLLKEETLTMMSGTYQQQELPSSFTFRIVESIKRIKIQPVSQTRSLPWGLSLATGFLVAIFILNPYFSYHMFNDSHSGSPLPVEAKVLKVGEIPVDVLEISSISAISAQKGQGKGGEPDQPDENAFFMAPQGEGGTWTKRADMPTARLDLRTCVVDGIIYAIGGSRNGPELSTVEAYDPETDTWTKKADMPTARRGLSICVVDGIIYAIGGLIGSLGNAIDLPAVEAYDPETDTWTKKDDMPTPRAALTTSVVDGIIYAIGGWKETFLSTVETYDPKMDIWSTKKADMPTPRYGHSACVVDGLIYIIEGITVGPTSALVVEVYNPKNDTWTKKGGNLPPDILNFSACVINKTIYALTSGGIMVYDLATDTWTEQKTPMLTLRGWVPTSVVNGKIYTIGGGTEWDVALNEGIVEEYTPEDRPFAIFPKSKIPETWGRIKGK